MKRRIGTLLGALVALLTLGGLGAQAAQALYWASPPVGGKLLIIQTYNYGPTGFDAAVYVASAGTIDALAGVQCKGDGAESKFNLAYAISAPDPSFLAPVGPVPTACPALP